MDASKGSERAKEHRFNDLMIIMLIAEWYLDFR